MPISTNPQVIQSFLNGRPAHAGNLSSDGNKLFSYGLLIAEWISQHQGVVVYDYTATGQAFRSMTTSQHVGLIKREVGADNIMLPEVALLAGLFQ